jgi:hypothetical protein
MEKMHPEPETLRGMTIWAFFLISKKRKRVLKGKWADFVMCILWI